MKKSELIKILKKHGVYKFREGGSHEIFYSPITDKYISVGRHAKEFKTGTVHAILKDAGIK